MDSVEIRMEKARNLRHKRPIVKDMNLDTMRSNLWDMAEACSDVRYWCDGGMTMLNELLGDEEESFEFQMAFSVLSEDIDRMQNDLEECYIPEVFDAFFVGIGSGYSGGGLLGYDDFQGDYFGLDSFESELAEGEQKERLMRLTKKDILKTAGECFNIAMNYISICSRYADLEAAMNILRGENAGILKMVSDIKEAYNAAEAEGFISWKPETARFERLVSSIPDRMWVE